MPTNLGIVGGRTYVSGPEDYAAVHALQDHYRLVPLEAWGSDWAPPAEVPVQPGVDVKTPVPRQVLAMTPETFFGRLNALLPANPPVRGGRSGDGTDRRAGDRARRRVSVGELRAGCAAGDLDGVEAGKQAIRAQEAQLGEHVNGWQVTLDMGRYGTRYAYRAAWTFFGVGGNLIEDACYPLATTDGEGGRSTAPIATGCISSRPAAAGERVLVADDVRPGELPGRQEVDRYALGDRSGLTYDDDGSLTLYLQSEKPDASTEANWLPTPSEGAFKVALRLYSPKPEVAQGRLAAAADRA